jgi:hypothetical protein
MRVDDATLIERAAKLAAARDVDASAGQALLRRVLQQRAHDFD